MMPDLAELCQTKKLKIKNFLIFYFFIFYSYLEPFGRESKIVLISPLSRTSKNGMPNPKMEGRKNFGPEFFGRKKI